jgi:hypothetical protein
MAIEHQITLIGTDSTHCLAFAKLLRQQSASWQITQAVRDSRSHLSISCRRVDDIEQQMQVAGIRIVDQLTPDIDALTDAYIIASVDASLHRSQFQTIRGFGKPVFIDKPIAYSSVDAAALFAMASDVGVPMFSSSSLRYSASVVAMKHQIEAQPKQQWQLTLTGPVTFEAGIPGFYWYGIHLVEALCTIFPEVFRVIDYQHLDDKKQVVVNLESAHCKCQIIGDTTGQQNFSGVATSATSRLTFAIEEDAEPLYAYLLKQMIPFFESDIMPVSPGETQQVMALVEAINARS